MKAKPLEFSGSETENKFRVTKEKEDSLKVVIVKKTVILAFSFSKVYQKKKESCSRLPSSQEKWIFNLSGQL